MNPSKVQSPNFFSFQSNFAAALGAYERALVESEQREVRLLCLHEVGWSQLLLLRWELASRSFLRLKSDSRWSKSFYSYLSAGGSIGFMCNPGLYQSHLETLSSGQRLAFR